LSSGLFVLPGHTWADIDAHNPEFDVLNSPVCVGVMPEVFRKRKGVYRSLHPTHSLLAYGCGAKEFVSGQEKFDTPCAPDSCYGKLEKLSGKVMLIGVDFMSCTLVHCIEEVAGVPERISDTWEQLRVRDESGRLYNVPSRRHQNANSDYYQKLEPVLQYKKVLTRGKIGDADTVVCNIKDLFSITLELLNKNIRLLDDDKPVPEEWYKIS
jgi:aminoglycoside 3-N-acetyltransferase